MSTFGVAITAICQKIFLSERENSIFSNRSTKMTSKKTIDQFRETTLEIKFSIKDELISSCENLNPLAQVFQLYHVQLPKGLYKKGLHA